jgi:subtilisin family serine protease
MLLATACGEQARDAPASAPRATTSKLDQELAQAFLRSSEEPRASTASAGEVAVIINFREPATRNKSREAQSAAIGAMQEQLLASAGTRIQLARRYRHVPALAARVTREEAERLIDDPNVASLLLDGAGSGQLKEAVAAVGGDQVKSIYGLTGRGVRVAVLDSGAATTHPDLKSAIVAQHCFTHSACPPLRTVEGTSAEDDHGHGTHVTGIITSDGTVAPLGFAPESEIVAVKVNDQNDAGMESDWVAGLDWLFENLATLKVRVVNLSLSTTAMHRDGAECQSRHPAMVRAIKNLTDAGVVVFMATGNSGSTTSMPAPACIDGPIAVGATYDARSGHQPPMFPTYFERWGGAFARCGDDASEFDQITCFTNSTARLDLVAPGAPIVSTGLRGRTDTYWGTSQASPAAAGVAALMLECNPALTPEQIKQAMVSTGAPVVDKRNSLTFPSLRALEAVRAACPQLGAAHDGGATGEQPDDSLVSAPGGGGVIASAPGRDAAGGAPQKGAAVGEAAARGMSDARASAEPDSEGVEQDEESARSSDGVQGEAAGHDDQREQDRAGGKGAGQGGGDLGCALSAGDSAANGPLTLLGFALALLRVRASRRRSR